jgi:hypothetical protein
MHPPDRTGEEEYGIVLGREVGRERLAHRVLGGFLDLLRRSCWGCSVVVEDRYTSTVDRKVVSARGQAAV